MWLLNKDGSEKKIPKVIKVMFSKTLLAIYLPVIVVILIVFVNTYI